MKDIRTLTLPELTIWFKEQGEPTFRAKQVYSWLWQKSAVDFNDMTNLSLELREKLKMSFSILPVQVQKEQFSNDGTIKSVFVLHDNHLIEGVMIPADDRATACVSSQVGCSLSCKFCATGFLKRERNLEAAEIYDQVVLIKKQAEKSLGRPLTNIVFMGMGEPLLNYSNVLQAIEKITSPEGLGMSPKRITVSTAGIAKMIKKLGDDQVKFNLALSLHAANDEKRDTIMAINEHNNIEALVEALNYFYDKTKNKITFEYILLNGVNDHIQDAQEIVELCRRVPAKVNILEYNKVEGADFSRTDAQRRDSFVSYLEKKGVTANIRKSRGKDIDAACGQLANKSK
ncbi:MAG: 23S rRNA (adenine(2503)-C(2))-methyltransferase RlmN [Chitinophagales bacterium]|nr:23S rRNA (adenine(2503)-C(2))-methyltransferase RlmN [Chitinophagales bacterium]MCZ2394234.1 23S rRNA (adenine(2503)-C(2))-methyltransferase RlmN [Chitinophagales bacterium]